MCLPLKRSSGRRRREGEREEGREGEVGCLQTQISGMVSIKIIELGDRL